MKKRNNIQKDILFIFISSFIVVVAWIGFNLYHIWITSTISQDLQLELTPINPDFDQRTIQQLKTRENVEPLYDIQKSTIGITPTPGLLDSTAPASTPAPTPLTPVTTATMPTPGTTQPTPKNSPINRLGQ